MILEINAEQTGYPGSCVNENVQFKIDNSETFTSSRIYYCLVIATTTWGNGNHPILLLEKVDVNTYARIGTVDASGIEGLKLRFSPSYIANINVWEEFCVVFFSDERWYRYEESLQKEANQTLEERLKEDEEVLKKFMSKKDLPLRYPLPQAQVIKII